MYQDSVLDFFSNGGIGAFGGNPPSFSQCISPSFELQTSLTSKLLSEKPLQQAGVFYEHKTTVVVYPDL